MEKERYSKMIREYCDNEDPFNRPWSAEESELPINVTEKNVTNYFMHGINAYTGEAFDADKSLKAKDAYQSGALQSWTCAQYSKAKVIIGRVLHSQRLKEAPLRAWVAVTSDGEPKFARCTCKAGLSETCSHVAVLLFALSDLNVKNINQPIEVYRIRAWKWNVSSHLYVSSLGGGSMMGREDSFSTFIVVDFQQISCTDVLAKWLEPPWKGSRMSRIEGINFGKEVVTSYFILPPLTPLEIDESLRKIEASGELSTAMAVRAAFCTKFSRSNQ